MRTQVLRLVVGVAAALAISCTSGPSAPNTSDYLKEIAETRAQHDQDMRQDPNSPMGDLPVAKRDALLPLPYYPPDASYRVPAALKLTDERPIVEMPTSTGALRRMQYVGVLEFTLHGTPFTLGAFAEEGVQQIESLFVPFADLTTGKDTYSAGRYLDLVPKSTGIYTIDFNKAYNPSCAYNERYECPYPPPSNRLKTEVRAGEKAPSEKASGA